LGLGRHDLSADRLVHMKHRSVTILAAGGNAPSQLDLRLANHLDVKIRREETEVHVARADDHRTVPLTDRRTAVA